MALINTTKTNSKWEKLSIRITVVKGVVKSSGYYTIKTFQKFLYVINTKWIENIPTTVYISPLTHNLVYHKVHALFYIHVSCSTENNVNLYVQFSNCSRPILAMYNDQKLCMWDRKY